MYLNNVRGYSELYEYVGMAVGDEDFLIDPRHFFKGSAEQIAVVKHLAHKFQTHELSYDIGKHKLQILEEAVTLMIPYAGIYHRNEPREMFVYDFGVKGIHYFKSID